MVSWLLGGFVGGAVGAAVWVAVGYSTNYEVGWIAWGIGFLTGFGVRYAAYARGEEDASAGKGFVAAAIAIGAIIVAKYIVFSMIVGGSEMQALQGIVAEMRCDDEAMIAGLANEAIAEATDQGKTVTWPAGSSAETASTKADYPPRVWQDAERRWRQLGAKGQQEKKTERQQFIAVLAEVAKGPGFGETFSPYDVLWLGLAVVTAYRVGIGSYGTE